MSKRVILIVLDGVGVGELPDAGNYNDENTNTLSNISEAVNGLNLPNMQKLGLGNITSIKGVPSNDQSLAAYGKMLEIAKSKDSTSGHWEIAGLKVEMDFPTFPNGFPKGIVEKFITLTGVPGILLNKPFSGTDAIRDFGDEHIKTRKPIIYTSADSVFQIACHEEIYPLKELYRLCEIARNDIFDQKQNIGRVIARPFLGNEKDGFYRTENRVDYSISPPGKTMLDIMKNKGYKVAGVGKIEDLFNFQGLTDSIHTKNNTQAIDQLIDYTKTLDDGLIFANLVDFDTLWGHRNNVVDFAKGLEYFDKRLLEIQDVMGSNDILILTADHGCDPTTPGTDHTREYVPLLVYGKSVKAVDLGVRETFSDIAATILDYFSLSGLKHGVSFLKQIKK